MKKITVTPILIKEICWQTCCSRWKRSKSQADNYALPCPLTEKEEAARRALSTILFFHIALKIWKISSLGGCVFCREVGLEELDKKDFWFSVRPSLCGVRELAKDYIADLNEFERKCKEKGILEGNIIWGVSVEDFPDLEPEACGGMAYIGELEC